MSGEPRRAAWTGGRAGCARFGGARRRGPAGCATMDGMAPVSSAKVTIVGAGAVGTAIAYACLIRGSAPAIALYDIDARKTRAEVLDLNHGTQFVPHVQVDGSDDIGVTSGSSIVVVTAGAKQKPGQSRLDLAAANVAMAQKLTPRLLEHSPEAIILFVTNPVDVVTYAGIKAVNGDPARIIGSGTVLDSSRFRYLIAQRVGLAVGNVHAYIVGEHGDSEISLWSSASIGGIPIAEFSGPTGPVFDRAVRESISYAVVNAAYEIIQGKGATSLAIGLSTARILEALLRDQHRVLPISTLQQGVHEISGVCLSLPTVLTSAGAGAVLPIPLSAREQEDLQASALTLRQTQEQLGL